MLGNHGLEVSSCADSSDSWHKCLVFYGAEIFQQTDRVHLCRCVFRYPLYACCWEYRLCRIADAEGNDGQRAYEL